MSAKYNACTLINSMENTHLYAMLICLSFNMHIVDT